MKLFFSYHFDPADEVFISKVYYLVSQQPTVEVFYWGDSSKPGHLPEMLKKEIDSCSHFVFFWLGEPGETQITELKYAFEQGKLIIPVKSGKVENRAFNKYENLLNELERIAPIVIDDRFKEGTDSEKKKERMNNEALSCAETLLKWVGLAESFDTGLPIGYPFKYEKDIINEYIIGKGKLSSERIRQGCPGEWPRIDHKKGKTANPVPPDIIGKWRDWDGERQIEKDPQVVPAALSDFHPINGHECLIRLGLTFPEAGPRYFLHFPKIRADLNVGIIVSGGIAPGINSVIAGIVKRHALYDQHGKNNNLHIWAYLEGFKSLLKPQNKVPSRRELYSSNDAAQREPVFLQNKVFDYADDGGSIIPTSRADDLMNPNYSGTYFKTIADRLRDDGISILYVIGGDGSMKAARALSHAADKMKDYDLAVVGVPKTMDNDILWIWQSFGFLSAVEWAKGAIRQIYTEVKSNPRICIIQLFGSDSGFVVTHAALASGVCDLVLIPEHPFNTKRVVKYIIKRLEKRYAAGHNGRSPYGIILLAETALALDAKETQAIKSADLSPGEIAAVQKYFQDDCRVKGQTPDELRSAGIKIIKNALRKALNKKGGYWEDFRVFTNEPRHLIRSIPPSSSDIIFGERLGSLAVDGAMAGYRDFMISQWLTEYCMVPLELVVLGRKRVPSEGIFWKSVRATTGQPAKLTNAKEENTPTAANMQKDQNPN